MTVRRDYRGRGISGELVAELLRVAREQQVADVLLECLPAHAPVYGAHGFEPLPGVQGNVYRINRTMIVMHRLLGDCSALGEMRPEACAGTSRAGQ